MPLPLPLPLASHVTRPGPRLRAAAAAHAPCSAQLPSRPPLSSLAAALATADFLQGRIFWRTNEVSLRVRAKAGTGESQQGGELVDGGGVTRPRSLEMAEDNNKLIAEDNVEREVAAPEGKTGGYQSCTADVYGYNICACWPSGADGACFMLRASWWRCGMGSGEMGGGWGYQSTSVKYQTRATVARKLAVQCESGE